MNTLRTIRRSFVPATAIAVVILGGLAHPASADAGDANPAIAVQASPSGFPAGSLIFGSAMLGQGSNPTGTIAFTLYGPTDPSCVAAPLVVLHTSVLGNGYYASANFVANTAGSYRWTAKYLGDANNNPTATTSCADPGSVVTLGKRNLSLRSQAANTAGTVTNSATIKYGSGPLGPTGTLTFSLFGAGNMVCAGPPIFTSAVPVAGNATYVSASFLAPGPGTYQWTVRYSGDPNNNAAGTGCADPANAVTVATVTPSGPTVTASPTVKALEQLTVNWSIANPTPGDWFALYAVGVGDSWVTAWRYTGGSATGTAALSVPWTAAGQYEVRLFANNSSQRLDISDTITLTH